MSHNELKIQKSKMFDHKMRLIEIEKKIIDCMPEELK